MYDTYNVEMEASTRGCEALLIGPLELARLITSRDRICWYGEDLKIVKRLSVDFGKSYYHWSKYDDNRGSFIQIKHPM